MAYVLIRRSDIPDSLVQLEALKPSTNHRTPAHSPPGQSGYVKTPAPVVEPGLILGPPDLVRRTVEGLAAYLMDTVEDAVTGAALTPLVSKAAGDGILALMRSGGALDQAAIDAELITAGAGAGTGIAAGNSFAEVSEILDILAGRVYSLSAGTVINDAGGNFVMVAGGSFTTASRQLLETGAFNISLGEGDIHNFMSPDFFYVGPLTASSTTPNGVGAVLIAYADDGTLL